MASRAGYIINEDWRLPDCSFVMPQTGLIAEYDNLSTGPITGSDISLLVDNKTTTYVEANEPEPGVSAITFSFNFDEPRYFNAIAFVAENISTFVLQAGDAPGLLSPVATYSGGPSSEKAKMFVFEKMGARFFNIAFTGTGNIKVYQVSMGESIAFPRTVDQGFDHPKWRSDDDKIAWQSNSPLPSMVIPRFSEVSMTFSQLPDRFIRKNWVEIAYKNRAFPMWFVWDLNNDPGGVVYGTWKQSAIPYTKTNQTSLRLDINGIC